MKYKILVILITSLAIIFILNAKYKKNYRHILTWSLPEGSAHTFITELKNNKITFDDIIVKFNGHQNLYFIHSNNNEYKSINLENLSREIMAISTPDNKYYRIKNLKFTLDYKIQKINRVRDYVFIFIYYLLFILSGWRLIKKY
jgi:hypothetical protein